MPEAQHASGGQVPPLRVVHIDNGHTDPIGTSGGDRYLVEILRRSDPKLLSPILLTESNGCAAHQNLSNIVQLHTWEVHPRPTGPINSWARLFALYTSRLLKLRRVLRALRELRPNKVVAVSQYLTDSLYLLFDIVPRKGPDKFLILHIVAPQPFLGFDGRFHLPSLSELSLWINSAASLTIAKLSGANIVVVQDEAAQAIRARFRLPPDRVMTVPVGVSPPPTVASLGKQIDVLFIGRNHRQKGIQDLEVAWGEVVRCLPSATMVVVGLNSHELASHAGGRALSGRVEVMGRVDDRVKFDLLRRARVLIFPSHFEGFPAVVLEALACGAPVVAYDISAVANLVGKGVVAIQRYDAVKLGTEVVNILSDDQRRKSLSDAAIDVSRGYSWDVSARAYLRALGVKESD
jgi:glycosyltransferase involved in cell wall biosynthesis